ncbi:HAD family phosphatase, partial [Brachyspira hampsonii]|nr:HAD family phosphatase [Brachyspira hampsonii]
TIGFDDITDFAFSKFMFIGENAILKIIAEELYIILSSNKYNIKPDNVMAFGDNNNDLEMLEFAGISVALENAEDTVKSKALYITKSNEE